MAGLRRINALPESFRFPEWRDDIFIARDSVVRYASYMNPADSDSDSDRYITKFYVANRDVQPGSGVPPSQPVSWANIVSSTTFNASTFLQQILDNDSDILALQHDTKSRDSDIRIDLDSDIKRTVHDFLVNDSDFDSDLRMIVHDYLSNDSDYDSDLLQLRHDFKAEDSDNLGNFDSDIKSLHDFDSDLLVNLDSDFLKVRHDFFAADSDGSKDIDSDLLQTRHDFESNDSDIIRNVDSDILMTSHNLAAADSDRAVNVDSDLLQLRHDFMAADSDIAGIIVAPSWDYGGF